MSEIDTKEISRKLARDVDNLIKSKVTEMIGTDWVLTDVLHRLKSIRIQNQPQETITFDDVPIIELWPPELTYKNDDGKFIATFTQKYRTFQPTKK